jgi:hypothetical protein
MPMERNSSFWLIRNPSILESPTLNFMSTISIWINLWSVRSQKTVSPLKLTGINKTPDFWPWRQNMPNRLKATPLSLPLLRQKLPRLTLKISNKKRKKKSYSLARHVKLSSSQPTMESKSKMPSTLRVAMRPFSESKFLTSTTWDVSWKMKTVKAKKLRRRRRKKRAKS